MSRILDFIIFAATALGSCCQALAEVPVPQGVELRSDLFQPSRETSPPSRSDLELVFHDDFATCDSIDDERFNRINERFKWFSDQAAMGGRNLGDFVSPEAARRKGWPMPLDCTLGHLRLNLTRGTDGRWHGAQIKTHSFGGHGFLLNYGYWEMDALLPSVPDGFVPWAAMWVRDRVATVPIPQSFEFDVLETGMHALTERTFQVTAHRWPPTPSLMAGGAAGRMVHQSAEATVNFNVFDGRRHRYGFLRNQDWNVVYVDGIERARFPMLADDMRRPVALLIDLAIMVPPALHTVDAYSMHVYEVNIFKFR